jgi:hypothetical protein
VGGGIFPRFLINLGEAFCLDCASLETEFNPSAVRITARLETIGLTQEQPVKRE